MEWPSVTLSHVCHYILRRPNDVFIFVDKKACILYYVPFHSLVYLSGDFDGTELELREEIRRQARAMLN